ncbi:MAG: flagellar export chaperone FlgN [Solirubrobacteraceae bacterium]
MSAVADPRSGDLLFTGDVLEHLNAQLAAARHLLGLVLEQGAAIRRRDVQQVVRLAGMLQAEMERRHLLEEVRMRLLRRAGEKLAMAPELVTLTMLEGLMERDAAGDTRRRSAELRGLLVEIQREHTINRTLMAQELAFLDHLLRLTNGAGGYGAGGDHASTGTPGGVMRRRVFDVEA